MISTVLILPMATLVGLTVFVMLWMLYLRVNAVRTRKLSPRYFKLNKGAEVPEKLEAVTQNYHNLLEVTTLFYVACILAMLLNKNLELFSYYAWAYVGFRFIHSVIHTSYNHIIHRLTAFAASCMVLIVMWIELVIMSF